MSERVRFGVAVPTRQGGAFEGARIEQAVELAVRAEALGLDSVWTGESLLARPRCEPLTLLAAVATRTTRITLGTGVLLAPLHTPLALAQRLATLDQLARGRVVIGTGIGIDSAATRREYAAAGVPFEQRVGRLVEIVRACRTLWSRKPEALSDDAPPPFWVGATVAKPEALRRTGHHFDGWFPTAPDAARYGEGLAEIRRAASGARRRPETVAGAVYLSIALDDDARAAELRLARYLESYYGLPFAVMQKVQGVFAGTPAQCAEWLLGYVRAGATHVVLRGPEIASQLDRIARELVPLVDTGAAVRAA